MSHPVAATTDQTSGRSVVVIGGGPRGAGWIERFAANQQHFPVRDVTIHVVDPYPVGPGRIWRDDQSSLLKLNSLAEDVTVFTDESSTIAGPIVPGPSLIEWVQAVREGRITDVVLTDPLLAEELRTLEGKSFPTRRLQTRYLDWYSRQAVAALAPGTTVVTHRDVAVQVDDLPDGRQRVLLESGRHLVGDVVVYALGHSGSAPRPEHAALADFAATHGLFYQPPAFTADTDLHAIRAGEPLIVRGFGLSAVDLLVLLGEGRGGRYERDATGRLRYLPSGREPRIFIGSGRGIPYHSKITSTIVGVRPEPRFFTAEVAARIEAEYPALDFTEHVWPHIAKELLHGYYAELFTGHPERVRVDWVTFSARFAPLDPFGAELHALVLDSVLDPGDELDLLRFNRPLRGVHVDSIDELQVHIRDYIKDDLARRNRPEHSATLGLFTSFLQALFAFLSIADSPNWTARSRERDLNGWWFGFFSYVASGPPGHRLEELLALSDLGIVTFLGADIRVEADAEAGVFRATGSTIDQAVTARALVDAWQPDPLAATSDNPALRSLIETGVGIEQVVRDETASTNTGRLVVLGPEARVARPDGTAHPRRYAIGPFTTSPFIGAFARPNSNAPSFRENDAAARAVLETLTELAAHRVADSAGATHTDDAHAVFAAR